VGAYLRRPTSSCGVRPSSSSLGVGCDGLRGVELDSGGGGGG